MGVHVELLAGLRVLHDQRADVGQLDLARARVRWFLSVDGADLPDGYVTSGRSAYRSLTIDGRELEFSEGFGDLHTSLYQEVLSGRGFGIEDARPAIDLVYRIRKDALVKAGDGAHPRLRG